jgi:hypothetical protein
MWTEAVMNKFTAPTLHLPGQIRKPPKSFTHNSISHGQARRQHQHTDRIYSHRTGLHENCNNK